MVRIDKFIYNAIAHARNRSYIVVYDITSDAERNKISDLLAGTGIRVQYSVFEARLTKKQLAELTIKLQALNIQSGFVKIYRTEQQSKPIIIGIEKENSVNLNDDCIII